MKRGLDLIVTLPALLLVAPLLLLVAVLIRLTSSGPVIYRQTRTGLHGRLFTIYKFRTMHREAETDGPVWPLEPYGADPRCTRIGRFLRWTGLDELPQLVNILKGDMSLVGPRPERPEFVETFSQTYPDYALRHSLRPGLTGLAQVKGLRGNTSIKDRLSYDLVYVRKWTPGLDVKILVTTLGTFFKNIVLR